MVAKMEEWGSEEDSTPVFLHSASLASGKLHKPISLFLTIFKLLIEN